MGAPPALWMAAEAAAATGGRPSRAWRASGVSIDSRTLVPGEMFVALKGPNFDGHAFVGAALAAGAAAAVVARVPSGIAADAPLLVVGDTLQALRDLGRAARARSTARVIAVTGSVGKTGIKDALRLVLAAQAPTVANEGSLNNHWGLPLSLARLPRDAAFAVFEMGMNHPGEIAPLSRLARPHVALISTIEAVHQAHFPSLDAIADAKAEIFAGVERGAVAVLNRDNDQYPRLAAAAGAAGIAAVVSFGQHPDAGVRLLQVSGGSDGSALQARIGGEIVAYWLGVPGRHWVLNSLAVLAAVAAAGGDARAAAQALATFREPKGRGHRHSVLGARGAFTLIDDSYNASPASMRAALTVLGAARPGPRGRRIAVLGDMLELGDQAAELHVALAGPLAEHGIDLVFAAGPLMAHLFEALPAKMRGRHAARASELAPLVVAAVREGDVVTVKGSHGSHISLIVDVLLAEGAEGARSAAGGN